MDKQNVWWIGGVLVAVAWGGIHVSGDVMRDPRPCSDSHAGPPPPERAPTLRVSRMPRTSPQAAPAALSDDVTLHGIVSTADGRAAADVTVYASEYEPNAFVQFETWSRATSDAYGRFTLDDLARGLCCVLAYGNGFVSPELSQPHPFLGSPNVMEFAPGVHQITLIVRRAAALEGRVLDENGEPLVGGPVEAYVQYTGANWFHSVFDTGSVIAATDESGRFRLDGLIPDVPHCVWVSNLAHCTVHVGRDDGDLLLTVCDRVSDFRDRNRPLEMADYLVRVVDSVSQAPLPNATVALRAGCGFHGLVTLGEIPRRCGPEGSLRIIDVPAVRYELLVAAPGYCEVHGRIDAAESATVVALTRTSPVIASREMAGRASSTNNDVMIAQVVPVEDAKPPTKHTLRGRVVRENGSPASGVLVTACPRIDTSQGPDDADGWALSGADGTFALTGLPCARYGLQAAVPGLRHRISMRDVAACATGIRIRVPEPLSVTVAVQDAERRPLPNIEVALLRTGIHHCCSSHCDFRTLTDQAGRVPVHGLDASESYTLRIDDLEGKFRGQHVEHWTPRNTVITLAPELAREVQK